MGMNALEDTGVLTGMEDVVAVEIRSRGRNDLESGISTGLRQCYRELSMSYG
jgi:hypothetical protein